MHKTLRRVIRSLNLTAFLAATLETVARARRLHGRMLGGAASVRGHIAGGGMVAALTAGLRNLWHGRRRRGSGRRVPLPRRVIV